MNCKIRIVIEKVDSKINKIIEKKPIEEYKIKKPEKIIELGIRHKE